MNKCKYCGNPLSDGTEFCPICGAMVKNPLYFESKLCNEVSASKNTTLSVGYLIWSVTNIIISASFFYFVTPLISLTMSIIALVKTIRAKDCDSAKRMSKLHSVKILNIISSVITLAAVILVVLGFFILFATSESFSRFLYYFFYYASMD